MKKFKITNMKAFEPTISLPSLLMETDGKQYVGCEKVQAELGAAMPSTEQKP